MAKTSNTFKGISQEYFWNNCTQENLDRLLSQKENEARADERNKMQSNNSVLTDVANHIADNAMVAEIGTLISKAQTEERQRIKKIIENSLEALSNLEHDRWARWEKYRAGLLASYLKRHTSNYAIKLTEDKEEDWKRKRDIPYTNLTEQEKDSDRVEARKTIEFILSQIDELK